MEPEQCFGDLGSRIIKEMKKKTVVLRGEKENKEKEERRSLQAAWRLKPSWGERGKRLRAFDVEIGQFETVNFNFSASTETPRSAHLLSLKNVLFFFLSFPLTPIICLSSTSLADSTFLSAPPHTVPGFCVLIPRVKSEASSFRLHNGIILLNNSLMLPVRKLLTAFVLKEETAEKLHKTKCTYMNLNDSVPTHLFIII